MKKIKVILIFIMLIFSQKTYANSFIPKQKLFPGVGIEKNLYKIKNNCIEGDIEKLKYFGGGDIAINFYTGLNKLAIRNKLSASGEGSVDIGRVLYGKAHISLTEALSTDDVTYNSVYELSLNYPTAYLAEPILTEKGKYALLKDPETIREMCGNYVISTIHLGLKFFVSLKVTFTNSTIKKEFIKKVNIGALWGALSKTVTHIDASEEIKKNTVVSLNAYQYGGDPSKLDALIGKNREILKGCTLDNFDPCVKAYGDIIAYSKVDAEGSDGLYSQMNNGKYSLDSKIGPAIIAYGFSKYAHVGYFDLDTSDLKSPTRIHYLEVQDTLDSLMDEYDEQFRKLDRIYFLQHNANANLRPNFAESLKFDSFAKLISENIRTINNVIDLCKQFDSKCIENADKILKILQKCDGISCSKISLEIATK
ncbi:hypothetical protein [Fluviispira multicolorata]|uniref:Uncharacterized protein n=1 Tax=Fluviispira multicolorata TaxID=2654512 RepID=A0A833JDE4_9BACT|nr:hypothetical protein [Fluviispira multicolorata]KAB8031865.1 hypothetical protein GCL57_04265 [Fluviispira multicolorata]